MTIAGRCELCQSIALTPEDHGSAINALARSQLFHLLFSYGIFLPFWGVWLKGEGIAPETIGMLLGAGLVARFLGSLLIAPRVKDPLI